MSYSEGRSGQAALNLQPRGNVTRGMDRILDMPRVALICAAAFSTANATNLAVPWDTIEYDTDGMANLSTAASQRLFTCRTAGLYLVAASVGFDANGVGSRQIYLRKNGVGSYAPMLNGPNTYTATSASIRLNAGDVVDVIIQQTSGGVLATTAFALPDHLTAIQACLISL